MVLRNIVVGLSGIEYIILVSDCRNVVIENKDIYLENYIQIYGVAPEAGTMNALYSDEDLRNLLLLYDGLNFVKVRIELIPKPSQVSCLQNVVHGFVEEPSMVLPIMLQNVEEGPNTLMDEYSMTDGEGEHGNINNMLPDFDVGDCYSTSDDEFSDIGSGSEHDWTDFENEKVGLSRLSKEMRENEFKLGPTGRIEFKVGDVFESDFHFREVLKDYTIKEGFEPDMLKNDKRRVTAKCSVDGCPWRIHASLLPDGVTFQVKTHIADHNCPRNLRKNKQATSTWIAKKLEGELRQNPDKPIKDMAEDLHEFYEIEVGDQRLYRARRTGKRKFEGNTLDKSTSHEALEKLTTQQDSVSSLLLRSFPTMSSMAIPATTLAILILSLFAYPATTTPLTLSLHSRASLPHAASLVHFSEYQSNALSNQVVSGLTLGIGAYFVRMGIGHPVQNYYWVIDTGSDVVWLQCTPCRECYPQPDPIFNPLHSSTYYFLRCGTTCDLFQLKACSDGYCLYEVDYGDGSTTIGDAGSETLTFQNSVTVEDVIIGCGRYNKGTYAGATGFIGLGRGPLSLPSQLEANSFSYCLVERTSTNSSTLEFNTPAPTESITVPLVRNSHYPSFWFIELEGISVEGKRLALPPSMFSVDHTSGWGGTIVDTGTTITRLPTVAYNALRDEFNRLATNLERADPIGVFETCFSYPSDGIGAIDVPVVSFLLPGNQVLNLPLEGVLITIGQKKFLAFAASTIDRVIIGNMQLQRMRVHHDITESVISFLPNSC